MQSTRSGLFVSVVSWACVMFITSAAFAEKVTLQKPVAVTNRKADKSKISGRVTAYDEDGFDVLVRAGETQTIKWSELDARAHFAIRNSLLQPKDADGRVELGRALLGVKDGKEWADKAFAIAVKIDPKTKEKVEEAKKEVALGPAEMKTDAPGKPGAKRAGAPTGDDPRTMAPPGDDAADGVARVGPKTIGDVEQKFWGAQTPEQQTAAVAELKDFAENVRSTLHRDLQLNETNFFLFYSDLDAQEAKNWAGLLDRMYGKLCDMFALDKKQNIWRGKAIVFVFKDPSDYRRFEAVMQHNDAGTSAGMCHTYGDGMVRIAFYRQKDELAFARVLVHESVHGFIHRFHSPVHVHSWINEGLAEWIATQLLADKLPNRAKEVRYYAQNGVRENGGYRGLLDNDKLEWWQYPVAEMLTTFMIEQSKKGYVSFVIAIKDGMPWPQALTEKYKAPRERLMPAFSQWLGVKVSE